MQTIAFWQTDVTVAKDIAGASRFFIDIFRQYHHRSEKRFDLLFLTDGKSAADLLKSDEYRHCNKNILALRSPANRFNKLVSNLDLLAKILFKRIRLIHICQYYHVTHYDRLRFIQKLPKSIRPKIVINWIHCNFPYEYSDPSHYNYQDFHQRFDPAFNNTQIDGVFAWYKLTKIFMEEHDLIKSKPYIYPVETFCCNTEHFKPDPIKENIIVWAARLHLQKRPEMYLEAVHWLRENHPKQIKGWRFLFYGNGPHREQFEKKIKDLQLEDFIEFRSDENNMSKIFNRSKCFVSTQDYENFTSLSMNEALSSGNAIISRNVGQTDLYVKEGQNGFLAKEDTVAGIGEAILKFISSSEEEQTRMQQHSLYLANKVHTPANFMNELDNFWEHLLSKK